MNDETIISFGGEVKSLSNGKIGGYLVKFSSATDPDLVGDFFTKDTDFGITSGVTTTGVYLNHRLPLETPKGEHIVVKSKIGEGTLSVDDNGILIEAILYNRKQYEKALAAMGWSSGTAAHLVDRKRIGKKTYEVTTWLLGLDASITPHPCEPRNSVVPLKSYAAERVELPGLLEVDTKGIFADMRKEREMSTFELWSAVCKGAERIAAAAKVEDVSGVQVDIETKVAELVDEYASELKTSIASQITEYVDGSQEYFYLKSFFDSFKSLLVTSATMTLDKHSESVVTAAQEFADLATDLPASFKAWIDRVRNRIEFREAKDGRTISVSTRERMAGTHAKVKAAMEAMQQIHSEIEELMKLAEPKAKPGVDMNTPIAIAKSLEADILAEAAKFEELQFNLAQNRR